MGVVSRLRPIFSRVAGRTLLPLALRFSGDPNVYSVLGVVFAGASVAAVYLWNPLAAAVLVGASGFMDAVDGLVARATGRASRAGEVLDATLDRISDFLYHVALLYAGASAIVVIASLAGSLIAPYLRARGDAAGVRLAGVGVAERGERVLIVIGGLAAAWLAGPEAATVATAVLAVLSWVTVGQRLYSLLTVLRRS
ncbi:MAG: CDP-alcohol phosphatidyltransferase family protein [Desulfurococcales archaeon]|nr:CDP-alcohol phosphatidyltransferase family protein [Desulfurococcales archaeon]